MERLVADLDPKADAYVVGQAVFALLGASRPVADFADELDELARYLAETPPSTAAFLDRAAALRALAEAGTHPDVVDRTIDDFFGSAYRRDGSWYHDPWYRSHLGAMADQDMRALANLVETTDPDVFVHDDQVFASAERLLESLDNRICAAQVHRSTQPTSETP